MPSFLSVSYRPSRDVHTQGCNRDRQSNLQKKAKKNKKKKKKRTLPKEKEANGKGTEVTDGSREVERETKRVECLIRNSPLFWGSSAELGIERRRKARLRLPPSLPTCIVCLRVGFEVFTRVDRGE